MPDFSLGKWRVQVRESGQVVREECGTDLELAYAAFERIAAEHVANKVTNVELQLRPADSRRFKAVEQIVGTERIVWAPEHIRELLGCTNVQNPRDDQVSLRPVSCCRDSLGSQRPRR